jgi:hypothetical protein
MVIIQSSDFATILSKLPPFRIEMERPLFDNVGNKHFPPHLASGEREACFLEMWILAQERGRREASKSRTVLANELSESRPRAQKQLARDWYYQPLRFVGLDLVPVIRCAFFNRK